MTRALCIVPVLLLAACTIGSTTTDRPALSRPAVGPDGVFWDAVNVAHRDAPDDFLFLLSPRFVHRSFLPLGRRGDARNQRDFDTQRLRLMGELGAAARRNNLVLEYEMHRLARAYMRELRQLVDSRFVETGVPVFDIQYTDEFGRAAGPNRARLRVSLYPKNALPEGFEPETLEVSFVQDGFRWLIDGIDPDPQRGAFVFAD